MTDSPLRRRDVEKILKDAGRAMHPREIAARLSVAREEFEELSALLDSLVDEGVVKSLPGGRVRILKGRTSRVAETRVETWDGALSCHPRGFGFVTSAGHEDVFIPANALFEAMHGDTVTIQVVGRSKKGAEGRVEGIVKRRSPRVAGVVRQRRKSVWVEPDDTRLRGPIVLPRDSKANDGDAAVINITRFPQFADELPEGELVEILGPQGDPQTEVRKILVREEIVEEHEPATLANAEQMADLLRTPKLQGRRDLRQIPLPTIDPEDARDHDDAIWVERTKTGYRVYIAIADVSEYVREDSALDAEARERGCTIYLPDRAIPMLPRALAGDLCSLLPEVERYCMCVIAELDGHAEVKDFEIVEGVMRSCARLTYGGVARTLGFDPESKQSPAAEAMKSDLEVLAEVSSKLRRARMHRGALDLDLPEARVVIDDDSGSPIEVKKRATRPGLKRAYSLVEEMMLLANELVAEWLSSREIPAIYRIHGDPDEQKLEKLATVAAKLDVSVRVEDLTRAKGAGRFLKEIANHPRKRILEMLMLRSLKQATYDTSNVGHFGLASDAYLHFTSPIRRYPDLRVHRQIKRLLRGEKARKSSEDVDDLQAAATESSKKERAAMEVEREVLDLYRTIYMKQHVGDVFDGRISGLSGGGIYVALEEPFCDVFVPFDSLGLDHFSLGDDEISVVGQRSGETIMLGDEITVEVLDAAVLRRKVLGKRVREGDEDGDGDGDGNGKQPFVGGFGPTREIPRSGRSAPRPARSASRADTSAPRSASRADKSAPRSPKNKVKLKAKDGSAAKRSYKPERKTDESERPAHGRHKKAPLSERATGKSRKKASAASRKKGGKRR